jgi:alpha-glucosidase (family GH31 glycosyl hydrolase)
MAFEFPEDQTVWLRVQPFLLGSFTFVAPGSDESGKVALHLPDGKWPGFWDRDIVGAGPKWVKQFRGSETLSLY